MAAEMMGFFPLGVGPSLVPMLLDFSEGLRLFDNVVQPCTTRDEGGTSKRNMELWQSQRDCGTRHSRGTGDIGGSRR